MDDNYLPLFITEPIYIVDEPTVSATDEKTALESEDHSVSKVEEPAPQPMVSVPEPKQEEPKTHELAIWTPPLTSQDKELLIKILQAIKKDFHTAHIMEEIASYSPHYKNLLCFGYGKELELKVGQQIPLFEPTHHASQHILTSVAPADLHGDPAQKKRLWEALQKMFL